MEFLEEIKEVLKLFYLLFLTQNWLTGQVGRPLGRPHQGPVDRRAQSRARLAVQWAGRPDQRAVLSGIWTVDRAVDRN